MIDNIIQINILIEVRKYVTSTLFLTKLIILTLISKQMREAKLHFAINEINFAFFGFFDNCYSRILRTVKLIFAVEAIL